MKKENSRRTARRIMAFCAAVAMVSGFAVPPQEGVFGGGSAVVASADSDVEYVDENGILHTAPTTTDVTSGNTTWGTDNTETWYSVSGDVTVSERITVNGDVKLILCNGATLKASNGIKVSGGNSLTVYGGIGVGGTLWAIGPGGHAGLGGNQSDTTGTINIFSGTVIASSGACGSTGDPAAIGGGGFGSAGTVNIKGGTVIAASYGAAAAIGGGAGNNEGQINISGGTIISGKSGDSLGIGYSNAGSQTAVNITGSPTIIASQVNGYTEDSFIKDGAELICTDPEKIKLLKSVKLPEFLPKGTEWTVDSGVSLTVTGPVDNCGTLINNGTLGVSGCIDNNGTLTVGTGGTVNIDAYGGIDNFGQMTVSGTVDNKQNLHNDFSGSITVTESGIITNSGYISNSNTFENNGVIRNSGSLNNDSSVTGSGKIVLEGSGTASGIGSFSESNTPSACLHTGYTYTSVDENNHKKVCNDCLSEETEAHALNSYNACPKCGYGGTKCGDNAYYVYDPSTYTLVFFGTGKANDNWMIGFPHENQVKHLVIEDGITEIPRLDGMFIVPYYIESISIPSSVTSVNLSDLNYFDNLKAISVDTNNEYYSSEDGILFNKAKTEILCYPFQKSGSSYVIPGTVESIGSGAFNGCALLDSITIPNSVTSIGSYAFSRTTLNSISIPDSVESIGSGAFAYCVSLEGIDIPNSVNSIGDITFAHCSSLISVNIPESVESIGRSAFEGCSSLNSITIPNSVESIGDFAFNNCSSIKSITIPDSVESIGSYAFDNCTNLNGIFIPNGFSVSNAGIPAKTSKVTYTVTGEGDNREASVSEITIGSGKTSVDIPEKINGYPVVSVDKYSQRYVGEHKHYGGTANCTEKAVCTICGEGYGETDPDTHRFTSFTDYSDASCTENAKQIAICYNCGKKDIKEVPDTALGHDNSGDWLNNTTDHWRICVRNGCTEILDKAEHSFGEWVITTPATEEKEGIKTCTCETCGYEKTESIAKLNHSHKTAEDYSKDETGHWHACSGCTEKVDFESHKFDEGKVTTPATEDTEGVRTYTCETCGYEKTESIAKLNHTHKTSEDYTMDKSGHWHACSGCTEKVDFESHNFEEGKVTTPATEDTEGVKTYTCETCGYTKTETISVIDPSNPDYPAEKVNSFVERLYQNVLGRPSDPSKESHIDNLNNGETATKVAYDFVFSPEFTELDISNEERVTIMYNTFLDRDPDPAGLKTWTKALDNGCSIGHIFYGFTQSGEFGEICDEYGIEQGSWEYVENRDKSAELTSFVFRLYTKALNRKFDVNGLNDHTGSYLEDHDLYQMAYNFIFSQEFIELDLSNEDFVDTMYRTFFDREADPDGRADWLGRLKSGCSREEVLAGFVGSQECADLVAKFGI